MKKGDTYRYSSLQDVECTLVVLEHDKDFVSFAAIPKEDLKEVFNLSMTIKNLEDRIRRQEIEKI